jgi:hypothetical protein
MLSLARNYRSDNIIPELSLKLSGIDRCSLKRGRVVARNKGEEQGTLS